VVFTAPPPFDAHPDVRRVRRLHECSVSGDVLDARLEHEQVARPDGGVDEGAIRPAAPGDAALVRLDAHSPGCQVEPRDLAELLVEADADRLAFTAPARDLPDDA